MACNEQPLLRTAGNVSRKQVNQWTHQRSQAFDQHRRQAQAAAGDSQEFAEMQRLEKRLSSKKKPGDSRPTALGQPLEIATPAFEAIGSRTKRTS
ncbi:hypothetical protein [Pseudomonas sp.]|uniref:hypothetical protein n=1 Tax=Pseudomonas sp. TaxID=306 RepID=UPI003A9756C1